jgi:hypothetical protein
MSTKYNFNETYNLGFIYKSIYDDRYSMNTFTTALAYDLDYIVLTGKRNNNCISVDVDIFIADGAHKPTGSSLGTVTVLQASLPTSEGEVTFTFASPVRLDDGQEYAVVVSCAGPTGGNSYDWNDGVDQESGYSGDSFDSGASWTNIDDTTGPWFQAWGTEASGPNPPINPSPNDDVENVVLRPTLTWEEGV